MSTRTIAVDSVVYEKLATFKGRAESFSKAIDRILGYVQETHTGKDILGGMLRVAALPEKEAETMLRVVAENRAAEEWGRDDLR